MAALVDTRMPGVYTQEVPTLPPSVALVPTAVPVFIGYTQQAVKENNDVSNKPVRIKSMRDYEAWFGLPHLETLTVTVDVSSTPGGGMNVVVTAPEFKYRMHYALKLYFTNGGGPCYIISVGSYDDVISKDAYTGDDGGIAAAKRAKEITILVMPDAVGTLNDADYGQVITAALDHCKANTNRVTVIDVNDKYNENEKVTGLFRFRMPSTTDQKKYGAAYYPFLNTTLSYNHADGDVTIGSYTIDGKTVPARLQKIHDDLDAETPKDAVKVAEAKTKADNAKTAHDTANAAYTPAQTAATQLTTAKQAYAAVARYETLFGNVKTAFAAAPGTATMADLKKMAKSEASTLGFRQLPHDLEIAFSAATVAAAKTAVDTLVASIPTKKKAADDAKTAYNDARKASDTAAKAGFDSGDYSFTSLTQLENANNLLFSKIKEAIGQYPVVMPPSAAIAGVYVANDFSQGVWKAPANVSLAGVVSTTVEIDDDFHADLNVDAMSGKSVNAIRPYTGRGILVFGARTLAGNDLEWRYISVRRTFCFIEDAIGLAMQDFVFAPNTRETWIKVKSMIGNFLNEIWKAGGLFGNTSDEAYQVVLGEPETMTDVDILEGRMIVDIRLRVARPAEFIILRYEHKFQANSN